MKSNFEKPNQAKWNLIPNTSFGWDHYKKFASYIPIITYGFKSVGKLRILHTDLNPYVKWR